MSDLYNLAILETVIQHGGSIEVNDLWRNLITKQNSTSDVLSYFPSCEHLRSYLKEQRVLFCLLNDTVHSPVSSVDQHDVKRGECFSEPTVSWDGELRIIPNPDEQALSFFIDYLSQKSGQQVPIGILTRQLSRANSNVKSLIENRKGLLTFFRRHSNCFSMCGNKVNLTAETVPPMQAINHKSHSATSTMSETHGQLNKLIRVDKEPSADRTYFSSLCIDKQELLITLADCKAMVWLLHALSKNDDIHFIDDVLTSISRAPSCVLESCGRTQVEVSEFIRKLSGVMEIDEVTNYVTLGSVARMHLLLCESNQLEQRNIIKNRMGTVYCVKKLWGIIDLGAHEHVFFDRSLFRNVSNLSKHFSLQEIVYFNAVLAPKGSRAKWRATEVWKEADRLANYLQHHMHSVQIDNASSTDHDDPDSGLDNTHDYASIRSLFSEVQEAFDYCAPLFASIRVVGNLDKTAISEQTSFSSGDVGKPKDSASNNTDPLRRNPSCRVANASPAPESPTLSGIPSLPGLGETSESETSHTSISDHLCSSTDYDADVHYPSSTRSVTTQTLFTGEIMATKLYHGD